MQIDSRIGRVGTDRKGESKIKGVALACGVAIVCTSVFREIGTASETSVLFGYHRDPPCSPFQRGLQKVGRFGVQLGGEVGTTLGHRIGVFALGASIAYDAAKVIADYNKCLAGE